MTATQDEVLTENNASVPPESPTTATGPAPTKSRPKIDLSTGPKERKRGKSMFGLVLGTLNKAKIEDKERNASEAAKKRQLIDQRLQNKLRKETDSVRRAEEVKKEKSNANRKEEDLQLKDSIFKYRRTHLPQFSKFLCTADEIPSDETESMTPPNPLSLPSRSHPPPLYYLPAILLPAQEAFLARRNEAVAEAVEKEWTSFREECKAGIEEVVELRKRVAEEEQKKKEEQEKVARAAAAAAPPSVVEEDAKMEDADMAVDDETTGQGKQESSETRSDTVATSAVPEGENGKDESTVMQADEDDAVEY
jgi:hypothetical protein